MDEIFFIASKYRNFQCSSRIRPILFYICPSVGSRWRVECGLVGILLLVRSFSRDRTANGGMTLPVPSLRWEGLGMDGWAPLRSCPFDRDGMGMT